MKIYPVSAFTDNYIWLIQENKSTICVDPGEALPVIKFVESNKLYLEIVLLTHHHNDHIGGLLELLAYNPKLKVYAPNDSRIPQVLQLQHAQNFNFHSLKFSVLEIPGHTSSHIAYFEKTTKSLFCGDTLFSVGCGRVFDGTIEQLHDSLALLKELPDDTKIFCGHEYTANNLRFAALVDPNNSVLQDYAKRIATLNCSLPSTLSFEKAINPFLRLDIPAIQAYAESMGCLSKDSLEIFKLLRREKDKFK